MPASICEMNFMQSSSALYLGRILFSAISQHAFSSVQIAFSDHSMRGLLNEDDNRLARAIENLRQLRDPLNSAYSALNTSVAAKSGKV